MSDSTSGVDLVTHAPAVNGGHHRIVETFAALEDALAAAEKIASEGVSYVVGVFDHATGESLTPAPEQPEPTSGTVAATDTAATFGIVEP